MEPWGDSTDGKACAWCGRVKYLCEFPARDHAEDGHLKICRICWSKRYRGKFRTYYKARLKTKTCADCGETLPTSRFYREKEQSDGRCAICKSCTFGRELGELQRMAPCQEMRGLRRCRMCQETKPLEDFYRRRQMPFGRGYRCSACSKKRREELRRQRRRPPGPRKAKC